MVLTAKKHAESLAIRGLLVHRFLVTVEIT